MWADVSSAVLWEEVELNLRRLDLDVKHLSLIKRLVGEAAENQHKARKDQDPSTSRGNKRGAPVQPVKDQAKKTKITAPSPKVAPPAKKRLTVVWDNMENKPRLLAIKGVKLSFVKTLPVLRKTENILCISSEAITQATLDDKSDKWLNVILGDGNNTWNSVGPKGMNIHLGPEEDSDDWRSRFNAACLKAAPL